MEDNESIIFRSGLTMSGIVLLALLSMISSVFIAEVRETPLRSIWQARCACNPIALPPACNSPTALMLTIPKR
ncbi:MAG: hypothetical protein IPL99_14965 [Candidatus Competibacteraceae bacterium]|nr:hypothetical protein [Candidatus Competibacteraceae bacterium]